jgi:hypothetical protein
MQILIMLPHRKGKRNWLLFSLNRKSFLHPGLIGSICYLEVLELTFSNATFKILEVIRHEQLPINRLAEPDELGKNMLLK